MGAPRDEDDQAEPLAPAPASASGAGRRRGRPPRISRSQIVEAAVGLGLDSFTMQGIAEALGVTAPALYSHVAGREEVLELVNETLRARLESFSSAATDWRSWLTDFAELIRSHLAPSMSSVMVDLHGSGTAAQVSVGERGLQLLMDEGLTAAEAGEAVWLVFRVAITAGPAQGTDFAGFVEDTGRVLSAETAPILPATHAVHEVFSAGPRDTFGSDLQIVLDGLAAKVARAAG